jgi:lipooligosaccharide transport system permease protein
VTTIASRAGRALRAQRACAPPHFLIIFSGFFEPLFYLLSMGVGLGHFVGKVPGPNGELVSYASFIAPALLATAAMNGAMYDASSTLLEDEVHEAVRLGARDAARPVDVAVGETPGRSSAVCSTPSRS